VPTGALVIPAIVRVPAVLFGSAQLEPARATVTTSVLPAVAAVAVHPANPVPRVTAGLGGSAKLVLKVTTIVLPAPSAPPAPLLVLNPIVQAAVAPPTRDEPLKVTLLTPLAAKAAGPVRMPVHSVGRSVSLCRPIGGIPVA
jgi:hypothetical protein